MMPYEFDYLFTIMFVLIFAIIAVTFIVILLRGVSEWSHNNHSPKLGVEATCVSKRTSVTHHSDPVAWDISGAHGYTHFMLRLRWKAEIEWSSVYQDRNTAS